MVFFIENYLNQPHCRANASLTIFNGFDGDLVQTYGNRYLRKFDLCSLTTSGLLQKSVLYVEDRIEGDFGLNTE
jgi:hypothetical protein